MGWLTSLLPTPFFTSAFFKANALYGPQGSGGIYSIDLDTGVVSNFLDIDAYFGADYNGPDISCDGDGDSFDAFCFHEVGQQSLGDLDISSDFQTLYSVGIRTDELFEIPVGDQPTAPVTINKYAIPQPASCTGSGIADYVPLGLGVKGDTVYVGTACTAQTSQDPADLRVYIYAFSGGSFTQVLDVPLDYPRTTNDLSDRLWRPWQPFSEDDGPSPNDLQQPWVGDILFDGEDLVFSILDRSGHQITSGGETPGGDVLRACWTGAAWSLESGGVCNGKTSYGNFGFKNDDGPGNGLYYWDQLGLEHNAVTSGMAQVPGYNHLVALGTDTRYFGGTYQPLYINHDTGASDVWSPVFGIGFSGDFYGKGNGMGDIEIIYDLARIETGNRVWIDTDGNGIQDPGEAGIDGVLVELWKGDVKVAETTTANGGQYLFSYDGNPNSPGSEDWSFTGDSKMLADTDYEVRIPDAEGGSQQGPLSGLHLTAANVPQPANGGGSDSSNNAITDVADSDGSLDSDNAVIAYTTGGPGANNHGLDTGFTTTAPRINLVKSVESGPTLDEGTGRYIVVYSITANNTGDGYGFYNIIDTFSTAPGINLFSAELDYLPGGADGQSGDVLGGVLPAPFDSGQQVVSNEGLASGETEVWTITAEFDVVPEDFDGSESACESDVSTPGTGFSNFVAGSGNGDGSDNNACIDIPEPDNGFRNPTAVPILTKYDLFLLMLLMTGVGMVASRRGI